MRVKTVLLSEQKAAEPAGFHSRRGARQETGKAGGPTIVNPASGDASETVRAVRMYVHGGFYLVVAEVELHSSSDRQQIYRRRGPGLSILGQHSLNKEVDPRAIIDTVEYCPDYSTANTIR